MRQTRIIMSVIHSKSQAIPFESEKTCTDPIYLITQFFLPKDSRRQKEVQYCLRKNCENPWIHTIYLLNEKIYSEKDLGVTSKHMEKIQQINIAKWIEFYDVFACIETQNIHGFVVITNSDIMLDYAHIEKLHYSQLRASKQMIALLRYEYNDVYVPFETNCDQSPLFGPRGDSQDTWIIHSDQNIPATYRAIFQFPFGKPGCDNKMIFLFRFLGYEVYNDPLNMKTYHFHRSNQRNYTAKDRLNPMFEYMCPYGLEDRVYPHVPQYTRNYSQWNFPDNRMFRNILTELVKDMEDTPFVIPAVDNAHFNGLRYDEVFGNCRYYFSRDVYNETMKDYLESENYVISLHPNLTKIWENLRYIPYFIFHEAWTLAFANKRICVISPYANQFKEKYSPEAYPIPVFFPTTTFMFLEWNTKKDPTIQHKRIRQQLQVKRDEYDVVFVDAGDYTNMLACDAYRLEKSALSIGDGLSLMFGMYTEAHVKRHGDFFRGFLNEHWVKLD